MVYTGEQKPHQAIELYTKVLAEQPENVLAIRGRADAYLNVGKHAEAIADFEKALKLEPEDDGVLNNLAWVLATSPDDKLRDGKRAIELATKACELTEYKAGPHPQHAGRRLCRDGRLRDGHQVVGKGRRRRQGRAEGSPAEGTGELPAEETRPRALDRAGAR